MKIKVAAVSDEIERSPLIGASVDGKILQLKLPLRASLYKGVCEWLPFLISGGQFIC